MQVELFAWEQGLGQPSFDPKCLGIETLLNLNHCDWVVHYCRNPSISPDGQLPVLRIGQEPTAGTSNIIKVLKSQVAWLI